VQDTLDVILDVGLRQSTNKLEEGSDTRIAVALSG
jgi:hypothetical protein